MPPAEPIPLSLITGFLGSGKTTLLNRILKDEAVRNTVVIINEFGDVSLDHLLVESADEDVIELSDGCLCCTVRGDLVDTLSRLQERRASTPFERIVVETTGLADPAPILHVIMAHPVLADAIRLDGIITLVDAMNGMATLDTHKEAVKQVAVADRLVLTKTDIEGAETEKLTSRLKRLNPGAPLLGGNALIPFTETLFSCGLYNPETKSADVAGWLNEAAREAGHHHHSHDVNRHDAAIRAFTLTTDKPVDSLTFDSFLDLLRSAHGPNLLRIKGIVRITEHPDQPVVIHGVQQIFHPPARLEAWPDDDHRTRLVMITRNLPESFVRKLFDAFVGNVSPDTPDIVSRDDNPLAIPGYSGNFD